ncbi:amino acid ABC transporter permease [Mobilicoccus caccae]|uniref:Amino acid ABC transporter permease n=1 Tax=Mobilicoccus caccae TaxID=1859295 RepID=A0ABQ6IQT6_9MICO|nr:amino acid ABC transporter permease [Mobilicoccus caccae]GMA39048.1 amino acid ABC transporter permease [Mobilicoccus caccae]
MTSTSVPTRSARAKKRGSPRQRARRIRLLQYLILAAVILAAVLLADWKQVGEVFFRPDLLQRTITQGLPRAFTNTLIYTFGSFVVGLILGTMLALMRLSQVAAYRVIATVYIEFFRGVPALIVFLAFGMLPLAFPGLTIPLDPYGTVWAALGLVSAAYLAETIRAGIQAVPKGQVEAARSLGMSPGQSMRKVVLPQAFRIILPPLTNEFILITKDSSLVYVIGLSMTAYELTKYGRDLSNSNANLTPLVVAGLMYLLITLPLAYAVRRLEAHNARGR